MHICNYNKRFYSVLFAVSVPKDKIYCFFDEECTEKCREQYPDRKNTTGRCVHWYHTTEATSDYRCSCIFQKNECGRRPTRRQFITARCWNDAACKGLCPKDPNIEAQCVPQGGGKVCSCMYYRVHCGIQPTGESVFLNLTEPVHGNPCDF